ncbi:hypothetical protein D3C72_973420 [compost metagenome]
MAFHVFRHIETQQLDTQRERQLPRHFGLAHTGGAGQQESADGLFRFAQARARHLDGGGQGIDRAVLAEHHGFQIAVQRGQLAAVVVGDRLRRNTGDLGHDVLDVHLADHLLLTRARQQALRGAGLVDDVDGLVGQMTVIDEACRQLSGSRQRSR